MPREDERKLESPPPMHHTYSQFDTSAGHRGFLLLKRRRRRGENPRISDLFVINSAGRAESLRPSKPGRPLLGNELRKQMAVMDLTDPADLSGAVCLSFFFFCDKMTHAHTKRIVGGVRGGDVRGGEGEG